MHGGEAVHEAAERLVQPFVRRLGIGPERVASRVRDLPRREYRAGGRRVHERHVGVPAVRARTGSRLLVLGAGAGDAAVEHQDFRVLDDGAGQDRMGPGQSTEGVGERNLVMGFEVLIPNEHDLVAEPELAQLGNGGRSERLS